MTWGEPRTITIGQTTLVTRHIRAWRIDPDRITDPRDIESDSYYTSVWIEGVVHPLTVRCDHSAALRKAVDPEGHT